MLDDETKSPLPLLDHVVRLSVVVPPLLPSELAGRGLDAGGVRRGVGGVLGRVRRAP